MKTCLAWVLLIFIGLPLPAFAESSKAFSYSESNESSRQHTSSPYDDYLWQSLNGDSVANYYHRNDPKSSVW